MRGRTKAAILIVAVAAFLMILLPRLWVKNSRAHLTIDGRVTDDFKLYFGPGGKLLLRIGDKQPQKVFYHSGAIGDPYTHECPLSEVKFPPFIALTKRSHPSCPSPAAVGEVTDNSLHFITRDHHEYEVTWQAPPR